MHTPAEIQSARGLAHSKTWRPLSMVCVRPGASGSGVVCSPVRAMTQWVLLVVYFCVFTPALGSLVRGAEANEEQLIRVLQSDRSPREKDAACARLKRVGTERCIPPLAALLPDEQLSHSARYALESMRSPKAGKALTEALGKTSGFTRIGIINSLGMRAEEQAVPGLARSLKDGDAAVAAAAASALGRIASRDALAALEAAARDSRGPVRVAAADASLRCAHRLLASGDRSKALLVFARLYRSADSDAVRVAGFRGMIQASGDAGLVRMSEAIAGKSGPGQTAALQLVSEVRIRGATQTLSSLLRRVEPPVRVALIGGLAQRGDAAAAPAIAPLVASSTAAVRLAAINALGLLGDDSLVALLAQSASSARGEEQQAARQALVDLRRGNITKALLAELATAKPAVQAEVARALGDRRETASVPKLLALAQQGPDSARKAALQALAVLIDRRQLDALVQFVEDSTQEDARAEAAEALNSVCQRIQTRHGHVESKPLVTALATGSTEARIALLPVCSGLVDPNLRTVLRLAAGDPNSRVRTAAIRALADTRDAELLPDLVAVASGDQEENLRTLAIGACVRLTTQEETVKLSNPQRIEALKTILASPLSAGQKRQVLAGLAEIPDLQAFRVIEPLLAESAVQSEAAQAALKIASALGGSDARATVPALKKLLDGTSDEALRRSVQGAITQIEANSAYITAWQVAGPYRQEGKDYAALFDIAFPPENGATTGADWRELLPGADPKRPWVMDLLKALGGEQCVAYARTSVHSEREERARLELGSDDGVKTWLNDKLVLRNNTARGIQPGSDKAEVTLKQGWNLLLLKITQNNQGWAFCARFVAPDGSPLEGLQFDAARSATPSAAR